ncbi:NADP(H)-dependent aldo-keto reductase [Aureibaculum sp. 2210JD6-5]|uniref:NADP(H)-dependent aldo-keto reductase n=1 Tax=Aureibaculum sp. 2210JD6-5 TaxID=3103957 RepID=UPI002AAD1874|nr:NADP(H)-dependent aldo-keto reductase [Aureibaculum sp. 2210JD6-5]MDY7395905.1 NADP(H)-dependent aldo-keto reductase [Aureibaculum sp. 2210JD6-5]
MKYTKLPHTDIKVSKICLGTMTWGEQNTEAEGHEQMDYALAQDVNFFDTAEMYSIPGKAETYGSTEKIIGTWFKKTRNREKIVLASKIAGPGIAHIRNTGFSKNAITEALHGSLKRLQTDYIDLYQLHWPERPVNLFGIRDYPYQKEGEWEDNFAEVLETLDSFIKEGKIRHIGASNETPWGVMRYLEESKTKNLPRMITIQNAYSLLARSFEAGLSEISLKEGVGLLAYSPLAFGVLSGKYLNGKGPKNGRINLFPAYKRYSSAECAKAAAEYLKIAEKHNLSLTQLSLAFINQLPFVTGNIIGATKMSQLKENIDSINIDLSQEVIDEINEVHSKIPNPAA